MFAHAVSVDQLTILYPGRAVTEISDLGLTAPPITILVKAKSGKVTPFNRMREVHDSGRDHHDDSFVGWEYESIAVRGRRASLLVFND